jgi:succinoglycan biosynthesis transport protein ExoP
MNAAFDGIQFSAFVRARWLTILICCAVAAATAATVSLLMPRRYTATASILIGPPAGLDSRAATSVSPVYLESLRTFEHVASSDSLFLRSLEHLGIRKQYAGRTVESLKKSVLRVSKPVNTRVIEISATLEDPRNAQALAQYIAEQTVVLSRSLDTQFSGDVAKGAEAVFERADSRLRAAMRASDDAAKLPVADALASELDNERELKFRTENDLNKARTEMADLNSDVAINKAQPAGVTPTDPPSWIVRSISATRARISILEARNRTLDKAIAEKAARLGLLRQRHETVDSELQAARADFESARAKLSDIRAAAAFRGERLDVFDPGIVPQRPSSPNTPLNVMAAVLFSGIASVFYLAFAFAWQRMETARVERTYSVR